MAISAKEMLFSIYGILQTNYTRIEQLGSGASNCQLLDMLCNSCSSGTRWGAACQRGSPRLLSEAQGQLCRQPRHPTVAACANFPAFRFIWISFSHLQTTMNTCLVYALILATCSAPSSAPTGLTRSPWEIFVHGVGHSFGEGGYCIMAESKWGWERKCFCRPYHLGWT